MQIHLHSDDIRRLRDELSSKESVTRRRSLLRYFGNAPEVEIKEILKIKKYLTSKTRDLQDASEFIVLLVAINLWKLHGALRSAEKVRASTQKAEMKAYDKRRKTCKDKVLSVIDEVKALKDGGLNWNEIREHLKKNHRTMFWGEQLHRDTLRKIYYTQYPETPQKAPENPEMTPENAEKDDISFLSAGVV